MRNFLLTATAIVSASIALTGFASAQTTTTTTTTAPPPPSFQYPSTTVGQNSGGTIQPGTLTVRLDGALWFDAGVGSDSGQTHTTSAGTTKTSRLYFGEFARLYPGFDAVAANGLQYGAKAQIRQNQSGHDSRSGTTLFWNDESGYVALPQLGKVIFGATGGAIAKFMVGTFEAFDYNGGWNGDAPGFVSPGTQLDWNFPENSGFDNRSKVIYLSPRFAGFDFGVSYEPNAEFTGDSVGGDSSSAAADAKFSTVSSTPGGLLLRKNKYDAAARYTGAFGPVGLVVAGGYIGSGAVHNSTASAFAPGINAKGLSIIDAGATITLAGFSFGGHLDQGAYGANNGVIQHGQRNAFSWIAGASYTFGPFIVGVQYLDEQTAGAQTGLNRATVGQLRESGVALGGSYDWAPAATFYVSAIYGQRRENGVNLLDGSSGDPTLHNKTSARALQIGNNFHW